MTFKINGYFVLVVSCCLLTEKSYHTLDFLPVLSDVCMHVAIVRLHLDFDKMYLFIKILYFPPNVISCEL